MIVAFRYSLSPELTGTSVMLGQVFDRSIGVTLTWQLSNSSAKVAIEMVTQMLNEKKMLYFILK